MNTQESENLYSRVEGILYSYKRLPFEIKSLEIEIKMIQNEYIGIKGKSGEMSSQTNSISSSVESEIINKERRIDSLQRKINDKKLRIDLIENAVSALKVIDEKEEKIIRLRYLEGVEWKQLATQLHMDEKSLMRKRSQIIKDRLIGLLR